MVGMTVPVTQQKHQRLPRKKKNSKSIELVTSGVKETTLQGGVPQLAKVFLNY